LTKSLQALRETGDAARVAMAQAQSTLASADSFIGQDSQLRHDLTSMFAELRLAARSIRQLTDYLEQNPDSLIYGKREADFQ
jgi:paraquat-inducible protein B